MRLRTTALLVTNAVLLSLLAGIVIGDRRAQAGTVPGTSTDEFPLVQDRTDAKNGDIITLSAPTSEGSQHILYIIDVRKRQIAAYQTKRGDGMALLGARDFRYDLFVTWQDGGDSSYPPRRVRREITALPDQLGGDRIRGELKAEREAAEQRHGSARAGGDLVATIAQSSDGTSRHVLYLIDVVKRHAVAYTTTKGRGIQLVGARRYREDLFLPWLRKEGRHATSNPTSLQVRAQLSEALRDAAAEERAVERGD